MSVYVYKDRCERLAEYLIENNSTVRATAAHFGISKSTVHKDVSERLNIINPLLYEQVKNILEKNKSERHLRGGNATREKYLNIASFKKRGL
ncbi:MAG: sporulation transcriptional regulator SpoIIID [Clostridia bacterium]|nr:sporulation transcriptional regulator SpoIIID [Clostridia bacterium]